MRAVIPRVPSQEGPGGSGAVVKSVTAGGAAAQLDRSSAAGEPPPPPGQIGEAPEHVPKAGDAVVSGVE